MQQQSKIDFFQKWYHTRSTHPIVSLDAELKKYDKHNDGQGLALGNTNAMTEEQMISEVI